MSMMKVSGEYLLLSLFNLNFFFYQINLECMQLS